MTIANFFTVTRLIAAPFFIIIYNLPRCGIVLQRTALLILVPLFVYMEFTDFLDGFYARKYNQVSDFGKLFDPFADVVANLTVLLAFTLSGIVPLFIFIIILYRELGILFVRMHARGNGITIGAKKGGKVKTVCYIFSEGFTLLIEVLIVYSFADKSVTDTLMAVNKVFYGIATLLSVGSFIDYLISYKKSLKML